MRKFAIFAFNGELTCVVHALLNALDLHKQGFEVKLILEGQATKIINELPDPDHPNAKLYHDIIQANLLDCVCRACASNMEAEESAKAQNLPLCAELAGHPSMARYVKEGYEIITF